MSLLSSKSETNQFPFFGSFALSELIGNAAPTFLPLIAIKVFDASVIEVGFIMILATMPWVVAPYVGRIIDEKSIKYVLAKVEALRFTAYLLLSIAIYIGCSSLLVFYLFVLCTTFLKICYDTGAQAAIPYLSPKISRKENRVRQNARFEQYRSATLFLGPVFGGLILTMISPFLAAFFFAMIYALAALAMAVFTNLYQPAFTDHLQAKRETTRNIVRVLFRNDILRTQVVYGFAVNTLLYLPLVYLVPLLSTYRGFSDLQVGLAMGSLGIGGIASSLYFRTKDPQNKVMLLLVVSLIGSLAIVSIGAFSSVIVSCAGMAALGVCLSASSLINRILRQEFVPDSSLAAASGLFLLSIQLTIPFASVIGMWLLMKLSISQIYLLSPFPLFVLWVCYTFRLKLAIDRSDGNPPIFNAS